MERPHATQPLTTRLTHWTNALVLGVLLWSGFAIFADTRGFAWWIHLMPAGFWSALHLAGHKVPGRAWHLGFAIVMIANGIFYLAATIASGRWRRIVPRVTWLRDAWRDAIEELRAPRESLGRAEYNGAQRVAYTAVAAMGALMVLTGLALWFGRQLRWLSMLFGGHSVVLVIHIAVALAFVAFIVVHIVQVLRAGLPTLLSMVVGTSDMAGGRARRGTVWGATSIAVVVAGIVLVRAATAPTGVPPFLQWTVEHDRGRARNAVVRRVPPSATDGLASRGARQRAGKT